MDDDLYTEQHILDPVSFEYAFVNSKKIVPNKPSCKSEYEFKIDLLEYDVLPSSHRTNHQPFVSIDQSTID